ncbi:MAG TPA: NAD(P)H-binding protein [Acidimicrobiales bacterium]|jgi:putative NADH-flavin reductase
MTTTNPLNVTVFGASGHIGRQVVDQLLAAGHHVTAYVRNPTKLDVAHPDFTVVEGELNDPAAIARAVQGADAVVSALGPTLKRTTTGTPVTDGTRNIVKAMEAAGVRRYIGLATPAVAADRDRPTFKAKVLRTLPRFAFPNALVELNGMTDAVRSSTLDWTIARITSPNDAPAKNTTRSGFLGVDKVGSAMTRADIAVFLVGQLTDDRYRQAAPAISN